MPVIAKVYDFDQTLNTRHSFSDKCLERMDGDEKDFYNSGKAYAVTYMKKNLRELFKHDAENLRAIATYHNNPAFIAGFIAHVLGKELTLSKTVQSKTTPLTAIAYYTVADIEKPFLISYIPACEAAYENTYKLLKPTGKNAQLNFLRENFIETKLIEADSTIEFYDDDDDNVRYASELPYTESYEVAGRNPKFVVLVRSPLASDRDHSAFLAAAAATGAATIVPGVGLRPGLFGGSVPYAPPAAPAAPEGGASGSAMGGPAGK